MYKLDYHKRVVKFIKRRVPREKDRILERLEKLKRDPYPTNENLDIKKIQGKKGYRLRVGDYRFLYDIEDNKLIIYMEDADNRGDIY